MDKGLKRLLLGNGKEEEDQDDALAVREQEAESRIRSGR